MRNQSDRPELGRLSNRNTISIAFASLSHDLCERPLLAEKSTTLDLHNLTDSTKVPKSKFGKEEGLSFEYIDIAMVGSGRDGVSN